MVILERSNPYQGIIFNDGVQLFIQGPRWEGDTAWEEVGEDFREFFNLNFAKISESYDLAKGIKVIKVNSSIDKFPVRYAKIWNNAIGKIMFAKEGDKALLPFCVPTYEIKSLDEFKKFLGL